MTRVFNGERTFLSPLLRPERGGDLTQSHRALGSRRRDAYNAIWQISATILLTNAPCPKPCWKQQSASMAASVD
jgi:hypothetical protein